MGLGHDKVKQKNSVSGRAFETLALRITASCTCFECIKVLYILK